MFQIRAQTFETNSSSTHTLAIVSQEDWQRFKSDPNLFIDSYGNVMPFEEGAQAWKEDYGWENSDKEPTVDDLADAHIVNFQALDGEWCGFISRELPTGGAAISCYYYD